MGSLSLSEAIMVLMRLFFKLLQIAWRESSLTSSSKLSYSTATRIKPVKSARTCSNSQDRARSLPVSPFAGQRINRVPFFWSGGLGLLIRKSAPDAIKDARPSVYAMIE